MILGILVYKHVQTVQILPIIVIIIKLRKIDQPGKNFGTSKNYNHHETDVRNRQMYDASYGRHNRAQEDGTHRGYPTNANDKNFKNQLNRCQPNDSSGGRGIIGPNSQRSQSHYSNNQNANAGVSTWVWRVGDKCLAKYWEDNRVREHMYIYIYENRSR